MPRLSVQVQGVVQGVGFRPFVHRIATERGLGGWVRNRPDGVELQVQGDREALEAFLAALREEKPRPARIRRIQSEEIPEEGEEEGKGERKREGEGTGEESPGFRILPSAASAETRPSVPADLATCPDCAREMDDPRERRHRYPFTNCTYCGPRYTIIEALPYDRPRTSMKAFPLCPECGREYRDPQDRRFHAQPVACPACGPRLELLDAGGAHQAWGEAALEGAEALLRRGGILALKGLGGFQLLVDAGSDEAVARLRERKRREEKPFAVMFPDLASLEAQCRVSEAERRLLEGPEAPILLLERRPEGSGLSGKVAPGNPSLGAFLPYTPLHRLLLGDLGRPLVCTSGNLSDEPMAYTEAEALERLGGIADAFLVHDRPILRPVDDSVLRVDRGGPTLLRRARGYAPLSHPFEFSGHPEPPVILALGAHQKNTVALLARGEVVLSQHLGDLDGLEGQRLQERTVADLLAFLDAEPALLACDLHPDYASTRLAERLAVQLAERRGLPSPLPLLRVQHHHAHGAAVLAEHGEAGPALVLAWDGTGYGTDGTIWGGEALIVEGAEFRRFAHLAPFPLPGGDRAAREPRRAALGLLGAQLPEAVGAVEGLFEAGEYRTLRRAMERGINSPLCSSMGRLFDAVAALAGLRAGRGFEGQAAMELEFAARRSGEKGSYTWSFQEDAEAPLQVHAGPLLEALLADRKRGLPVEDLARRFHNALVELAVELARRAGMDCVVLGGGCFQNRILAEEVAEGLEGEGFRVLFPREFPPNDGAVSLGQAAVAGWAYEVCTASAMR